MRSLLGLLFIGCAQASTVKTDKLCLREGVFDSCVTITGTSADSEFTLDPDGTNGQVLTNDGSGNWTWQNSAAGFSDPMTTRGDMIYRDATNTTNRLAVGSANQVLTSDGTDVSWEDVKVTSSGSGVTRVESATITGGSSWSSCTSSPCTVWKTTGDWISSVTRSSTGLYTLNINSGTFSDVPSCTTRAKAVGVNDGYVAASDTADGPSTIQLQARVASTNTLIDMAFHIICVGPN